MLTDLLFRVFTSKSLDINEKNRRTGSCSARRKGDAERIQNDFTYSKARYRWGFVWNRWLFLAPCRSSSTVIALHNREGEHPQKKENITHVLELEKGRHSERTFALLVTGALLSDRKQNGTTCMCSTSFGTHFSSAAMVLELLILCCAKRCVVALEVCLLVILMTVPLLRHF